MASALAFYCRTYFPDELEALGATAVSRFVPTHEAIVEEANDFADRRYNELSQGPGDGSEDLAALAETAVDESVDLYTTLSALRQTLLNLLAVGLLHLFLQQRNRFKTLQRRAGTPAIAFERLPSYSKVIELEALANAVKHAEGKSSQELRRLRPDLVTPPYSTEARSAETRIVAPMSGEDIYVKEGDILDYKQALVDLWHEVASEIEKEVS